MARHQRGQPFVAVGEILWDLLPNGRQLGGAPFNVLAHAARFGRPAAIVSAVGADALGALARSEAERLGVGTEWLTTVANAPTGVAEVTVDRDGGPAFRIAPDAAYLELALDEATIAGIVATQPAAIIHGTLAQSRPAVHALTTRLVASCPDALVLYDANFREGWWDPALVASLLRLATVIKLSSSELAMVLAVLDLSPDAPEAPAAPEAPDAPDASIVAVAQRTGARVVCVTDGARGATLLVDGVLVAGRPPRVNVTDAVGAGDAFAAALLDGLRDAKPPEEILRVALALGALVASRAGAVPEWDRAELQDMVMQTPDPSRR